MYSDGGGGMRFVCVCSLDTALRQCDDSDILVWLAVHPVVQILNYDLDKRKEKLCMVA